MLVEVSLTFAEFLSENNFAVLYQFIGWLISTGTVMYNITWTKPKYGIILFLWSVFWDFMDVLYVLYITTLFSRVLREEISV